MAPKVFITGPTGTQGSGLIRALAADTDTPTGTIVHALVRDPDSEKAQSLLSLTTSKLQVKLFKGTYDDGASLLAAAKGATGAFILVNPSFNPTDSDAEFRHATNILSTLKSTSTMSRVIYTSVLGCADPTVPGNFKNLDRNSFRYKYYASKNGIEESVAKFAAEKGWKYTILRPGAFLSNFFPPLANMLYPDLSTKRKIVTPLTKEFTQAYLDPDDIGRFAARVFLAGDEEVEEVWDGRKVGIASRKLTFDEVVGVMNDVAGLKGTEKELVVEYLPLETSKELAKTDFLLASSLFMLDNPVPVDLEEVKGYGVQLGGIKEFFEANKEKLEKTLGL
jgi:uncharacterized protein YbjT (DUF2867 family)